MILCIACSTMRGVGCVAMMQTFYSLVSLCSAYTLHQSSPSNAIGPSSQHEYNHTNSDGIQHFNATASLNRTNIYKDSMGLWNETYFFTFQNDINKNLSDIDNITQNIQAIKKLSNSRVMIGRQTYIIVMLGGLVCFAVVFILFGLSDKADAHQSKAGLDEGFLFKDNFDDMSMV